MPRNSESVSSGSGKETGNEMEEGTRLPGLGSLLVCTLTTQSCMGLDVASCDMGTGHPKEKRKVKIDFVSLIFIKCFSIKSALNYKVNQRGEKYKYLPSSIGLQKKGKSWKSKDYLSRWRWSIHSRLVVSTNGIVSCVKPATGRDTETTPTDGRFANTPAIA